MGKLRRIIDGLTNQQRYVKRHPMKAKACSRRYVKRHPARVRASRKKWRLENPAKWRKIKAVSSLKRLYGKDAPAHKSKQIKKQRGKCAVCRQRMMKSCLDHKGKVLRGVLCNACNLGIGFFKDSRPVLRRAIDYLRKWGF